MKKLVYVVCGLNASRSQAVEEFLKGKYNDDSGIEVRSAGMNVFTVREDDKRTLFTKEMAEESDIIFAMDSDQFYRIRYNLLENKNTRKLFLLRIPDIFHSHKNALFGGNLDEYVRYMEVINQQKGYPELRTYIAHSTLKTASDLTEALYLKEIYSAHRSSELRQDKKYPFELLYKTLEFRFPQIDKIIKSSN